MLAIGEEAMLDAPDDVVGIFETVVVETVGMVAVAMAMWFCCLDREGDERVFFAIGGTMAAERLAVLLVLLLLLMAVVVAPESTRIGMLPASSSRFGSDSALRSGAPGAVPDPRLPFDDVVVDDRLSPDSEESAW